MLVEFLKVLVSVGSTLIITEIMRQIKLRKKVRQMVLTTVRHNLREKYGYELKGLNIIMEIEPSAIITEDNFMKYYIILKNSVTQEIVEKKNLKLINK